MNIKPIETSYSGYKFRSRLEARWAVFFDTAGIVWEYEKEGFKLPSGSYLPDFWISNPHPEWPQAGSWIEIKPKQLSEHDFLRACRLLAELTMTTKHTSHLLIGDPGDFVHLSYSHGSRQWTKQTRDNCDTVPPDERAVMFASIMAYGFSPYHYRANASEAIRCARSARFEHRS